MSELQGVKLTVSEGQFDKLRRGHAIQISAANLSNGKHMLFLGPANHKKVMKARKAKKGVRIELSRAELEKSAEGLKDFLKSASNFYQKHIKSVAAPFLKKGVESLANVALTAAETAVPSLATTLEKGRQYIPNLTEKVGKVTGAYGLMGKGKKKSKKAMSAEPQHPQYVVESDYGTRLGPYHPARWQTEANNFAPGIAQGGCAACGCGGSFRPSGGYVLK